MKSGRQSVILDIIQHQNIETQRQLQEALLKRGVKSTQATLSRDIKDMRLVKELGPTGTYRYTISGRSEEDDARQRLQKIVRESVISYQPAMNLLVIKTIPGLAPAVCSAVDGMSIEGLAGTLAGDDTAFLAMTSIESCDKLSHELQNIIGR
ncbi:MAG: arginine repressor [Oscillospiraceae bacterium]|nr:arginine repressor [Oscillospiraceae bacterium]